MANVEQVKALLLDIAGDGVDLDELARAIVSLDDEATKETRVLKAAEIR